MTELILFRVEKEGLKIGEKRRSRGEIIDPREWEDRMFSTLVEQGALSETRMTEDEFEQHRREAAARREHDRRVLEARQQLEERMRQVREAYADATAEANAAFEQARVEAREDLKARLSDIRAE